MNSRNQRESKILLNSFSGHTAKWHILILSIIIAFIFVLFISCENKRTGEEVSQSQSKEKPIEQNKVDTISYDKTNEIIQSTRREVKLDNILTDKKEPVEEIHPIIIDSIQQDITKSEIGTDTASAKEKIQVEEKIISKPVFKLFQISDQIINEGEEFRTIYFKEYLPDLNDEDDVEWELSNNKFLLVENITDSTFNIKIPSDDFYGSDTITVAAFNKQGSVAVINTVFTVKQADLINKFPFKPVKDVLVTGVTDVFSIVINPVSWEADDYLTFGAVVLGGAALFTVDKKIHEEVSKGKSFKENDVLKFGKLYGETLTSQVTSLSVTAAGIILNEKKITRIGLELFESYIITDRLVYIFKYMFGRDRPEANDEHMKFNPFDSRKNNKNALPSGHAALSFSLSTVLSSLTDDPYLKGLFYIPAVITCASRVYQNYHWTSDVFIGATLGYFVGNFIVDRHNKIFDDRISFSLDQQGRIGLLYNF